MRERFALSEAQKDYFKGRLTLKNESKEKIRIRLKAIQAWSIFVPILKSKVVDWDWKISLFKSPTTEEAEKIWNVNDKTFGFKEFLDALLITNPRNPDSEESRKMELAEMMIEKSISYYKTRYEINPLISEEIERFENVLKLLKESIRLQTYKEDAMKMYLMRKKQRQPPYIARDEFYHAFCIHCYNFTGGVSKTEEDAIQILKHDEHCSYNEEFERRRTDSEWMKQLNYTYLRIFEPIQKS